jgi:hypothetical protein
LKEDFDRDGGILFKQNGYGRIIHHNQDHYEGKFKDGMIEGHGTFSNSSTPMNGQF